MEKFIEQKGNQLMANYQMKKFVLKEKMKDFFLDEKGESHLIAVILVLVVVVGIAFTFKEQIELIVEQLWAKITGETDKF